MQIEEDPGRKVRRPLKKSLYSPLPCINKTPTLQVGPPNNNLFEQNGILSKRFGASTASLGPLLGDLGSLGSSGTTPNGMNPYEKWSNGTDKMFINGGSGGDTQNSVS